MSNIKVEDLIALATGETTETTLMNHADRFVRDLNLKPGNRKPEGRVQSIIVYWFYMQWCLENNEVPMSRYSFFPLLKKYFTNHKMPYKMFYHIMPDGFPPITREIQRAAEMDLRDEHEMRKHSRKIKEGLKKWRAKKRKDKVENK